MAQEAQHPCLNCGACCAYFRVSFYWQETQAGFEPWQVPITRTVPIGPLHLAMRGTDHTAVRCECLKGDLGSRVHCSIYDNRPSPCRKFKASFEDGEHNPRCDQARLSIGLKPLKPSDF